MSKYVYVLFVVTYGPFDRRGGWIDGIFNTYSGALEYCDERGPLTFQEILNDRMTDEVDTVFFNPTSLGSKDTRYCFTLQRYDVMQ